MTNRIIPSHGGYHSEVTRNGRRILGPIRSTRAAAELDANRLILGRHPAGCPCCDPPMSQPA
jgi:hypothetical protein